MKKLSTKTARIFTAILVTIFLNACSSAPSKTDEIPETPKAENPKPAEPEVSNHPLSIPNDVYASMLEKSIIDKGNNYRIKKFLEKLRSGEQVFVACIGGSVTEGAGPNDFRDGYAYQFSKKLISTYAPKGASNLKFDGAGLSGSSSVVGLVRYEQDVVNVLGTEPDLLVIEFAVNDGADPTKQRAFEELIRRALSAKPDAAVIALYAAATYPNTQNQMKVVANHYQIPQVSVQNAINYRQNSFEDKKFYTDYVHPTKEGHTIMAECLMNIIDIADKSELDEIFEIPATCKKEKPLSGFKQILGDDENVKISAGSFNSTDNQTQSLKKTNKGNFPINWHRKPDSGSESFKMEVTCSKLIFVHKDFGNWGVKGGKAEVIVDGIPLSQKLNGFTGSGWNNCVETIIIDSEETAKHTVEVKMIDEHQDRAFSIIGMGYSK